MSKKTLFALFTAIAVLAIAVSSVGAITDGELDGEDHPHVVLLLMEIDGEPAYRCTGTLLSPTVLLTAGHCVSNYPYGDFSGMRVFTESDVENGDNIYPYAGNNTVEAVSWAAHPLYETEDPFYFHDVGIVILEAPGVVLAEYGTLPEVNQFDALMPSHGTKQDFTAVGYGLQASFPDGANWKVESDRTRMVASPHLLQLNAPGMTGDFSMLLSNNHNTGGTCYGDSGGANFLGDTNIVAGITSFGMNVKCAGTGGVFRTDRQNVQDFIYTYYTP